MEDKTLSNHQEFCRVCRVKPLQVILEGIWNIFTSTVWSAADKQANPCCRGRVNVYRHLFHCFLIILLCVDCYKSPTKSLNGRFFTIFAASSCLLMWFVEVKIQKQPQKTSDCIYLLAYLCLVCHFRKSEKALLLETSPFLTQRHSNSL